MVMYRDRVDAGQQLAEALKKFKDDDVIVLALPRGGVVLGAEVARQLQSPLSVILVRKIGHPDHAEYAIGAVAEGESPIYNKAELVSINKEWLADAEASVRELIMSRRNLYFNNDIVSPDLMGKVVIIVDDGIATGLTMKAAVLAVQNKHPKKIVVAVPVCATDSAEMIKRIVDEIIILSDTKDFLGAIGAHFERFDQVDDKQVRALLVKFSTKKEA